MAEPMESDPEETAIFWIDGHRFVAHDEEIDKLIEVVKNSPHIADAWVTRKYWFKNR